MKTESPKPSVFSYSEFRLYLSDFMVWKKAMEPKFSHRYVNQKVGAKSAGWLSDLIKGRFNIRYERVLPLLGVLNLGQREKDYLEALIHFEQAEQIEEKNRWYKRLSDFKERTSSLVAPEQFEFYSEWYYSAIRELLSFYVFKDQSAQEFEKLGKKMFPQLTVDQIKNAISLLAKLELIKKNAQGRWLPTAVHLKKDSRYRSKELLAFHKSNLNLALEAQRTLPQEERDISAITVSLGKEEFQKIKEEIKTLRKKIVSISEDCKNPEQVYQINIQFYPESR